MDKRKLARFRRVLLDEKQRLIVHSKTAAKEEISVSQDDRPDEADLAAIEISQNLVFRLRDRERLLLSKIDQALKRVEEGDFGVCEDCEEPIEIRRLEARPITTFCLSCKEVQEHREKVYA